MFGVMSKSTYEPVSGVVWKARVRTENEGRDDDNVAEYSFIDKSREGRGKIKDGGFKGRVRIGLFPLP